MAAACCLHATTCGRYLLAAECLLLSTVTWLPGSRWLLIVSVTDGCLVAAALWLQAGCWLLLGGCCLPPAARWLLPTGSLGLATGWLLPAGCCLLPGGCWPLVAAH